jgi:hypothetical protein
VFDPIGVMRTLDRHGVRFVLIGGYAAGVLGAPIITNDLDICYDRSRDNLEPLANALRELGARLRVAGVSEELPFILDARSLAAGDSFTFQTRLGDVDVLGTPSGTAGFKDLNAAASSYDLGGGLRVRVVSLDDLIRMKEAAARPKDQAHLHVLTTLREMIRDADRGPST